MASRERSNEQKHDLSYHQQKLNVSINIFYEENIKKLDFFWLITNQDRGMIMNPVQFLLNCFDYEYFNIMTQFLVYLVIFFVGFCLKFLRMSRYKCMTPFRDHLHLVLNKYFFHFIFHFLVLTIYQMNNC